MEKKKKVSQPNVESSPNEEKNDWGTGSCPFYVFADEDAAEYDMQKLSKFFSKFKRKDRKDRHSK